jgi:hypothetical protein
MCDSKDYVVFDNGLYLLSVSHHYGYLIMFNLDYFATYTGKSVRSFTLLVNVSDITEKWTGPFWVSSPHALRQSVTPRAK